MFAWFTLILCRQRCRWQNSCWPHGKEVTCLGRAMDPLSEHANSMALRLLPLHKESQARFYWSQWMGKVYYGNVNSLQLTRQSLRFFSVAARWMGPRSLDLRLCLWSLCNHVSHWGLGSGRRVAGHLGFGSGEPERSVLIWSVGVDQFITIVWQNQAFLTATGTSHYVYERFVTSFLMSNVWVEGWIGWISHGRSPDTSFCLPQNHLAWSDTGSSFGRKKHSPKKLRQYENWSLIWFFFQIQSLRKIQLVDSGWYWCVHYS